MAKKMGYIHLYISGFLPILSKCQYRIDINNAGITSKLPLTGSIQEIGSKTIRFQYDDTKISIDDMLITYQLTVSSSAKPLKQGTLIASNIERFDIISKNSNSIYIKSTNSITKEDANNKKTIKVKRKKYLLWEGIYFEVSTGRKIVDTKVYEFNLTSECVSGIKYTVRVRATAEVFVIDRSIFGNSSSGRGGVVFYQNSTVLDPNVFNGVFVLGSISAGFGHTFAGPMAMGETLGDASGAGLSSDVIAIEMGRGTAKVISYTKESCN